MDKRMMRALLPVALIGWGVGTALSYLAPGGRNEGEPGVVAVGLTLIIGGAMWERYRRKRETKQP